MYLTALVHIDITNRLESLQMETLTHTHYYETSTGHTYSHYFIVTNCTFLHLETLGKVLAEIDWKVCK